MRPIKFQAWDSKLRQMRYGTDPQIIQAVMFGNDEEGRIKVREFTGLLDKNGKEIYEGDILRVHRGYQKNREYTLVPEWGVHLAEVRYVDGCVIFKIGQEAIPLFRLEGKKCISTQIHKQSEVLGNIYEHPHLMKAQP